MRPSALAILEAHPDIARRCVARAQGNPLFLAQLLRSGAEGDALPGSEDFAFMLERVPGSYLFIGNGAGENNGAGACMVHNPGYDFNDRNIGVGSAYWVLLAQRFLAQAQ